jgi:mono/diheme cytochrome c family protein
MKTPRFARARWLSACLLAVLSVHVAHADDHGTGVPATPLYQQECGACHLAFPAGMLPATSWQRLMGKLTTHFGVDASLDAAALAELTPWLATHAGTVRRITENPPEDRISRSPWFVRKHHDVGADTWKRASIRSASNCAACHRGAETGDFDEDKVRIPK